MSLSQELRVATAALHRRAERSGFVARLLGGGGTVEGYALLMRNLLPVYLALERGLAAHPPLAALARREVFRSDALRDDLCALCGGDFAQEVVLLAAGKRYAARVSRVAAEQPLLLAAHAYTRYLGDLSGGAVLGRLLGRSLSLEEDCLSFYRFPRIESRDAFKCAYRAALDEVGLDPGARAGLLEEARRAFAHNIDLSEAVGRAEPSTVAAARPSGNPVHG